jgi:acyl-CoA thioester hydrolase
MFEHTHQLRVRYAETDQMAYVYYGNYAQYYEVGRVEAMRSLGLSYAKMEAEWGVMMPVMKMEIEFLRPAFYDELLTMVTTIPQIPGREIVFESSIYNEKNKLVNQSQRSPCVLSNIDTKKRVARPGAVTTRK